MTEIRGKRVTVAGLGHFGGQVAAARWLVEQGANVLVTDRATADKLADSIAQLEGLPIEFRLGEHRRADFTEAQLIVASPAVPPHNEFLAAARAAGVPITTEICLFVERCPAPIVGITGTKGKSTTTAILGEMLKQRFTTWVGGNIGHSLLSELGHIDKTQIVILELSSYMLDYLGAMKWSPHIGLVTMIAADHIEWHTSHAKYVDAKKNIVRFQRPDDVAILNGEDACAASLREVARSRVIAYRLDSSPPFELALPGRHNQLNAQGAFVAAHALGVTRAEAQAALKNFAGLPHRLQLVGESGGVRFYNDSIATIPESAIAALVSFPPRRVIQIVGGYDHHLPIAEMCAVLNERAKAVLCIGATGDQVAGRLGECSHSDAAAVHRCGDLSAAMQIARKIAVPGDVVLLSTGYKSFDQFANFERRGEAFVKLVRDISL